MKRLIGLMIVLIPLGIATAAGAEPAKSGALELGAHQVGTNSTATVDSERMANATNQVNQQNNSSGAAPDAQSSTQSSTQSSQNNRVPSLLPEGMVVRSSTFGGVSVGVEF